MNYIYYVWIDLIINDILAVKQQDATSTLLEQLNKENIKPVKIKSSSTLGAIQKYKNTNNIHSSIFNNDTTGMKLH